VRLHTGKGKITVNLWLTPDSANLGSGGGLEVFDATHPAHMDWNHVNKNKDSDEVQEEIKRFLESQKVPPSPHPLSTGPRVAFPHFPPCSRDRRPHRSRSSTAATAPLYSRATSGTDRIPSPSSPGIPTGESTFRFYSESDDIISLSLTDHSIHSAAVCWSLYRFGAPAALKQLQSVCAYFLVVHPPQISSRICRFLSGTSSATRATAP
jgi:hypothetical protein